MNKMVLIFVIITLLSGNIIHAQSEVERPLGDFSGVSIQYNIEAELLKGTSNKVVLTYSGIKENKILSEITDKKLYIGFKSEKGLEGVTVKAKIYCTGNIGAVEAADASSMVVNDVTYAKSLAVKVKGASTMKLNASITSLRVNVSGSSRLAMTAKAEAASVSTSGSSKVQLNIETNTLDAKVSSRARLDITGVAQSQKVIASNSGKFMGYGLKGKSLTAQAHSSGRAEVYASESITANVVSDGKVFYKGNPTSKKFNGTSSGKIEKAEE